MARRKLKSYKGNSSAEGVLHRRRRTKTTGLSTVAEVVKTNRTDMMMSRLGGAFKNNGFRYGDYLHVSDVIGKCMRMIALSYKTDTTLAGETLYDNTGVTFAIGDAIHDYVKAKAIRNNPEEVYGRWRCHCGGEERIGTYNEAISEEHGDPKCPLCGELPINYEELYLTNEEFMISGAVDLSHLINGAIYITELKSMKHEKWETLTKPLADHILQVMFYWWLAKEKGYALHDQVSVVYITKSYVFGKSPFKEFVLKPDKYLKRIEEYKHEAATLKISRAGGDLPKRICSDELCTQAKKCELNSLCFGWDD